jgi:hypothetical protein
VVAQVQSLSRFAGVNSLQADLPTARPLEEPDAVAKQDRRDMQVDLVDQAAVKYGR